MTKKIKSISQNTFFWFIVILFSASLFRIFFLNLIEFKADEALTLFQITNFYDHPSIIQRGIISGLGVYNFPLFTYLMIILGFFSKNPQFLSFLIALVNTFLVALFFLVVKKFFNLTTAIFSSLTLAFLPWGIIFSRKIWAQDLILLFLIPLFYLLSRVIFDKDRRFSFLIFLILTLLSQLHSSGIFLFVATLLIFATLRIKISLRGALLGIIIGAIPTIPFITFQITSVPFCPDCLAFLKYQNTPRVLDFYNFFRPLQIMGGTGFHFVLGTDYESFAKILPISKFLIQILAIQSLFLFLGALYILRIRQKYFFLLIYSVIIPTLYFVTKTKAFTHYFVILIPFLVIIYSLGFNFLFEISKRLYIKIAVIGVFGFFLATNIIFQLSFNKFLSLKQNVNGDYGPIFSQTQERVEAVTSQYQNSPSYQKIKTIAYLANSGKVEEARNEIDAFGFDRELAEKLKTDLNLK